MTYRPHQSEDAAYQAFRAEVLGKEAGTHDLTEARDGTVAVSVPGYEPGRKFFGAADMEKLAAQQDGPISEADQVKDELREQNHRYHFEAPDPTDGMSDDELFDRMPKPWRSE